MAARGGPRGSASTGTLCLNLGTQRAIFLRMDGKRLIDALDALGLSKPGFARLVGVSLRAVNMWCTGDRETPGPVVAYLRLLASLPRALQAAEIATLEENPMSYDGLYNIEYAGAAGGGTVTLVFMDGLVFGHDGGVAYDGTYEPVAPGLMDVRLKLVVAPGVALVQGVPPQPAEYSFHIGVRVPARGQAPLQTDTPYGPIAFRIAYLRPLPDRLAA